MDWTDQINKRLSDLGLYPEVAAYDISDLGGHIVLVAPAEVGVYKSAEGCYRFLAQVEPADDLYEQVVHALHPNRVHDVQVIEDEDSGHWRQDPQVPIDEA